MLKSVLMQKWEPPVNLLPVLDAIHFKRSATCYLVGGAVRDLFLDQKPKDLDLVVTGVSISNLQHLLSTYGKCTMVGKSFGIFKFRPFNGDPGEEYDFALPRKEQSTGDGHCDFNVQVEPYFSIETDLQRRDFTVNSMAVNTQTRELVDPYGGAADCASKTLRLVFPQAFVEDPLRMLRAVQFSARFGLRFDYALSTSMKQYARKIGTVSPERVSTELCKLLMAPKPSRGFALLRSHDILERILPELAYLSGVPQPKKYHRYDVFSHSLMACDHIPIGANRSRTVMLRLTALLHDIGKLSTLAWKEDGDPTFPKHDDVGADLAAAVLKRLKFSAVQGANIDEDMIVHLIRNHMFHCDYDDSARVHRRFLAKIGRPALFSQLRLRVADRLAKGLGVDVSVWVKLARKLRTIRHGKAAFGVKDLAIDGNDIMQEFKMKPGPEVGKVLDYLLKSVIDDPSVNTRETLIDWARDWLAEGAGCMGWAVEGDNATLSNQG